MVQTAGRTLLAILMTLAAPGALLACPVCFGTSDSPMATGMNNAVLALLAITAGVLASFGAFFIYLMRRASLAGRAETLGRPVEEGGSR